MIREWRCGKKRVGARERLANEFVDAVFTGVLLAELEVRLRERRVERCVVVLVPRRWSWRSFGDEVCPFWRCGLGGDVWLPGFVVGWLAGRLGEVFVGEAGEVVREFVDDEVVCPCAFHGDDGVAVVGSDAAVPVAVRDDEEVVVGCGGSDVVEDLVVGDVDASLAVAGVVGGAEWGVLSAVVEWAGDAVVLALGEECANVEVVFVFAVGRRGEEVACGLSCVGEEVTFVGVSVADDAEVEVVVRWSVDEEP